MINSISHCDHFLWW